MFHALLTDDSDTISITFFKDVLNRMGLQEDDQRLQVQPAPDLFLVIVSF